MDKIKRLKKLVELCNYHCDLYYNIDKPEITDKEYDKLYQELKNLESETGLILTNSPTQNVGYQVISKLQKVNHKTPLLSLDKTKSIDKLNQWRNNKPIIFMLKADGLTNELEYNNGELISASTRGNGEIGELITHNILTFLNIPKTIPFKGYLRITGEAIIHWDDFNEINSKLPENEKYKTPRNLCSGSVRQLNSKICAERKVYFYVFNILECSEQLSDSKYSNLNWLYTLGFDIVPTILHNGRIDDYISTLQEKAKKLDIPIDGLVASFDSISYSNSLGQTSHHPLHSIALKEIDETEETILRSVEWNTTRTGQINPTAVFDTVELDGTEVSRASLFNLTFIKDMGLHIGCRIKVSKRNMIIPYIEENLDIINKDNIKLEIPYKCPSCGEPTYIKNTGTADFLFCKNQNCPAQLLDKFVHFVSRDGMNIEGLSEQTLEKFINKGFIKTFSDIYRLEQYKSQIISMDGFGIRSYNKLIEAIEKSKNVKFENFIFSLGIQQIGIGGAKRLAKHFKNDINAFLEATNSCFIFLNIEDFGDVTTQAVVNYFRDGSNMNQVDKLLHIINVIKPEEKKSINSNLDNPFKNKKIYGTGTFSNYKKEELKTLIESLGGVFTEGYVKSLDYLIVGSIKGSSKEDKAKKDGIKILSENEFMEMIK